MLATTGLLVGGFFLGSFALQHAHGYSALHAGLVLLPIAVATVYPFEEASTVNEAVMTWPLPSRNCPHNR